MFCSKCGNPLKEGAKFCTKCGTPVKAPNTVNQQGQAMKAQPVNPQSTSKQQSLEKQPTKTKSKPWLIPLIIGLIVVAVAIAGVAVWKLVIVPAQETEDYSREDRDESEDRHSRDEKDEHTDDNHTTEMTEDASTQMEEAELNSVDDVAVYGQYLSDRFLTDGKLMNSTMNLVYHMDGSTDFTEGILGAIIEDLDGDENRELIVIYGRYHQNNYGVYADAYCVREGEIQPIREQMTLLDWVATDVVDDTIYLKKTDEGYHLICDAYDVYCHWADGGRWTISAYDCSDLSFDEIAYYSQGGSCPEEDAIQAHVNAAHDAGLQNVTQGYPYGPLLLQDNANIQMICDISTEVVTDYTYYDYDTLDGKEYGTMFFRSYVDSNFQPNQGLTNQFINDETVKYEQEESWQQSDYDYILPDSSTRLLTDADIADIKDSKDMLSKARNEIYARHGRRFKNEELQAYFDSKYWYAGLFDPDEFPDELISDIERANLDFIKEAEKKLS